MHLWTDVVSGNQEALLLLCRFIKWKKAVADITGKIAWAMGEKSRIENCLPLHLIVFAGPATAEGDIFAGFCDDSWSPRRWTAKQSHQPVSWEVIVW